MLLFAAICWLLTNFVGAQEAASFVPQPEKFPPPNTANRRGGLRLDGDGPGVERNQSGPLHYFAMLSYGEISYNGAMMIDDAAQIKAIASAGKADGYRLRTLIENLVLSELMRKR